MRRVHAIVALALTSSLALLQSSCLFTGKPKTPAAAVAPPQPKPVAAKPAAPSEALSVPQTNVELPPPQPVNKEAVALPTPMPEAGAPPPAVSRPVRRTAPLPPQPKPPDTPAPAVAPPVDAGLAPVREVLTDDERKRFQQSVDGRKKEINRLLTKIKSHRLSGEANREVKRIESLVAQFNDLENRGDMRQADALAERALILAQELTDGK
jgi:hypothetical protein